MSALLNLPGRPAPDRAPVGTWLKIPAVEPVEIVASAGFDFVIVDLEHTALTLESAQRIVTVAALGGVAPLVRVPDHGPSTYEPDPTAPWAQRARAEASVRGLD